MTLAWLALFDGMIAIALAGAGIISAHFGMTPSIIGFQIFLLGFFVSAIGLILGIIAILVTWLSKSRRSALRRAVFGTVVSAIVFLPVANVIAHRRGIPPINDITTDVNNPLDFVHAQDQLANQGRDMKYDAAKYAAIQQAAPAYKDLGPFKSNMPPDDLFKKVAIIAGEVPSWQIMYNDSKTHTLEGVATSQLFRFKDDFVIRVEAAPNGAGSIVEMRSKSRDGKGDLGVNYNRIKGFFSLLAGPGQDAGPPQSGGAAS
jgi:uncharacterized protein (DUF1499 family)